MHTDIPENEPKTNQDTMKKVIERWPDNHYHEEKELIAENENKCIIQWDVTENDLEANQHTLKKVMKEISDDIGY